MDQGFITRSRLIFNRALTALPITQHDRIWPWYIDFVKNLNINEQGVRIFRRLLKFAPEETKEYIDYLISIEKLDDAALKLAYIVNSNDFTSKRGRSKHQLLNELCNLIVNKSIDVNAIIRRGVCKFINQAGSL